LYEFHLFDDEIENDRREFHYLQTIKILSAYFSLMGEYWYWDLSEFLGFPEWKTATRYRNEIIERLGLFGDFFEGNPIHLRSFNNIFFPEPQ
jgi:hypothetical protein